MYELNREQALYTKQAIEARCVELYSLASAVASTTDTNHYAGNSSVTRN